MPLGFRSISGLDNAAAAAGLTVSQIPGDGGAGPTAFVIFFSASGLPPNDPTISIEGFPGSSFSVGSDSNGNISCTVTWVNSGDDIHFNQVGGGSGTFPDGFWNTLCRIIVAHISNDIEFDIQFADAAVLGFTQDLTHNSDPVTHDPPNWNGDKGDITLHVHVPDPSPEVPVSIAIVRDGVVIANVPFVPGTTDYSYQDFVFAPATYTYDTLLYAYPDSRSALGGDITVPIGGPPSIELVMDGGFDLGGSMVFNFLVDPSGIYKLVIGSTHDVLYNRADPLDIVTVDVAIPTPFIKTFFMGK